MPSDNKTAILQQPAEIRREKKWKHLPSGHSRIREFSSIVSYIDHDSSTPILRHNAVTLLLSVPQQPALSLCCLEPDPAQHLVSSSLFGKPKLPLLLLYNPTPTPPLGLYESGGLGCRWNRETLSQKSLTGIEPTCGKEEKTRSCHNAAVLTPTQFAQKVQINAVVKRRYRNCSLPETKGTWAGSDAFLATDGMRP